ncbi:MAG TPA: CPBP family glutamic-type intramembrane protease [Tepidisphaeraceae bacterium]|nr:CPBP family glutamic-type intramembrane protease [Tepidisphaeraceae bacterium]
MADPQPILDPDSPPVPTPLPVAVSPLRFCRSCGSSLPPDLSNCPRCSQSSTTPIDTTSSFALDIRLVKSSLYLYFTLLGTCMIFALVDLSSSRNDELHLQTIVSIAISLIVVLWCLLRPAGILTLLRHTGRPLWYPAAIAASLLTFTLASTTLFALHQYLKMPILHYLNMFAAANADWRWGILIICVQPALFEELAFRGFIQTSLSRVIGPYEAVVTSALMFAILHCSIPSMPHLFLLGLFTALLRLKSGSLYPGMLLHFSHNLLVLLTEHYGVHFPW